MRAIHNIKLIAALGILFLASCSMEQAVFTPSEDISERIDMIIEGNEVESIFVQDAGEDLVNFNFYGVGSHQFDIRVNIGNGRTLVFNLTNETTTDLWEAEVGYSIYASRDLEDKQKFVTVEIDDGSEIPSYRTHEGNVFPQGTYVNVFKVVDYSPATGEILCRIIDLPMKSTASQELLNINGTFRGAVDFLN